MVAPVVKFGCVTPDVCWLVGFQVVVMLRAFSGMSCCRGTIMTKGLMLTDGPGAGEWCS